MKHHTLLPLMICILIIVFTLPLNLTDWALSTGLGHEGNPLYYERGRDLFWMDNAIICLLGCLFIMTTELAGYWLYRDRNWGVLAALPLILLKLHNTMWDLSACLKIGEILSAGL